MEERNLTATLAHPAFELPDRPVPFDCINTSRHAPPSVYSPSLTNASSISANLHNCVLGTKLIEVCLYQSIDDLRSLVNDLV
jgi:hypothetical protein